MDPIQHSLYSHLPPEGDHHHQVFLHPFLPTYEEEAPPFPCAIFLSQPCQEGSSSESDHHHSHHPQQEVKENLIFSDGSSDHGGLPRSALTMAEGSEGRQENSAEDGDPMNGTGLGKWMSSKMRFMRKMMMGSDSVTPSKPRKITLELQDQQVKVGDSNNNNNNNSPPLGTAIIRVCSDCNTTKTPLWRSGPRGPKSLCNACGIRQRKARRAMAALTGGLVPPVATPVKGRKEKRPDHGGCTVPFKKRFKFTAAGQARRKKLRFDEFAIDLGKSSAFHRVFPQDEKEAAILLMGLSCGLIHS